MPFFDIMVGLIDAEWNHIRITFAEPWEIPWVVSPGDRDDYEILYLEKGKGRINCGGRQYDIASGEAVCWNSIEGNSFIPTEEPFRFLLVTFEVRNPSNPAKIEELNSKISLEKLPFKLSGPEEVQSLLYRIHREIALKSANYQFRSKLLLGELVCMLRTLSESGDQKDARFPSNNGTHPFINKVIIYLQVNYMRDICLKDLGSLVNLHPRYLCTLFRQITGKTINAFTREIRLEKAKRLLLYTSLDITDIAMQVGFNSSQYFSRVFSRETGVDPSTFRKTRSRPV